MKHKITVSKSWQAQDLGVYLLVSGSSFTKKSYLKISVDQAHRGICFVDKKPAGTLLNRPVVNLLRKHVPYFRVLSILSNQDSKDLWILCQRKSNSQIDWYLKLSATRPPELSLISNDKKSFFRLSSKGTFTHLKDFKEPLPQVAQEGFVDILPILLKEYIAQTTSEVDSTKSTILVEGFSLYQRETTKRLARKLKTLKAALKKTQSAIITTDELLVLENKAKLLKTYLYLVEPKSSELFLPRTCTNLDDDVIISLDPKLTPGENLDQWYQDLHKKKKSSTLNTSRASQLEKQVQATEKDLEHLRQKELTDSEIAKILDLHRLAPKKQETIQQARQQGQAKPYKKFLGPEGEGYLVGKNANASDILVKTSKSNDYWFHVVGTTGSHVMVPFSSIKESGLTSKITRRAGILALYYSKDRENFSGEVYLARRAALKKKKGSPPGLWSVDRAQSFFVRYDEQELKDILDTLEP